MHMVPRLEQFGASRWVDPVRVKRKPAVKRNAALVVARELSGFLLGIVDRHQQKCKSKGQLMGWKDR